jgi:hypothetical protein
MRQPIIAHLRAAEVKSGELGHPLQMRETGIGDPNATEIKEAARMNELPEK